MADDDKKENRPKVDASGKPVTKRGQSPGFIAHQFKKGAPTANPGGRPKGLAALIREETNNLQKQREVMVKISLGQWKGAKAQDILRAIEWLADRSNGRAVSTEVVVQADQQTADAALDLSSDQLVALHKDLTAAKVENPPALATQLATVEPLPPAMPPESLN